MRVALFLEHAAAVVDPRGTEQARYVETVRQPIDPDREIPCQIVDCVLRQIGVRAFVVDINRERRRAPAFHGCSPARPAASTWRLLRAMPRTASPPHPPRSSAAVARARAAASRAISAQRPV